MSTFQSVEEAQEYFRGDHFATDNGMRIEEIGDGTSVCSMEISERHRNANHRVMGGAIFTLADFAFAAASNNVHVQTVAQQVSVNFLSGSRGTRLTARAKCRRDGRKTAVYNVDVTDDLGCDIAELVFTGFKL
ncbi:MAG: PaaI family thioesterase [Lachnospiraceae bacterium]|nr:PaaI family thioesterase [Lachnospiraceae bacterium]MCI1327703.1 PaaI family thioesterase [Lachnospiraceae bacterium]